MDGSMSTNTSGSIASGHRATRRAWIAGLALGLAGLTVAAGSPSWAARATPETARSAVRIGTYDSRAIGLAFGRSPEVAEELRALRTEHQKAKASGDTAQMTELEKKGVSRQIRMHLQVFSNAPVEDAMDAIRDQLPDVAARTGVVGIVSILEYHDATVEAVDVTDELVKLFHPSEQTIKIIAECRKQKPLPIEEIAQMPADE